MDKIKFCVLLTGAVASVSTAARAEADYRIRAAEMTKVRVTSGFWFDRMETNRVMTLRSCFAKCNETPRIANFTNAANRAIGTFGGIPFDDSDVFKVMEGAAYVYAAHPDPELMKYMTWLIGEIAKAQEPDGYLYTARTLGYGVLNWSKRGGNWCIGMMGPTRWSNLSASHELYNPGHMIEAAVAWYNVTGHDDFLKVAVKSADLMCRTFGNAPTQLKLTSGHQEIELALCKLYRATGDRRYLEQAKFFLDMRGNQAVRGTTWGVGNQDHLPVVQQDEAVGHAVRAGYMYSGMADVAALTGDSSYVTAIDKLWQNVVGKKLHLTGGIGAHASWKHPKWGGAGECFGGDYDLPNDWKVTYLETCAAIANALWNQRLFLTKGESKYVDVLERTIHNGFPSGISLTGDRFFYPNPLACTGGYERVAWFGCSCCPVNDVRFIPQVPSFAFASKGSTVYWNLFMEGEAEIAGAKFAVKTSYPWSGHVELKVISINPQLSTLNPQLSTLKVRIPGWACGKPVPSDLYVQTEPSSFMEVSIAVNGLALNGCPGEDGYVAIGREWKVGDVVTLDLPMPVKRIRANAKVKDDVGRLAVEKGPILYCAEGVDNPSGAYAAKLPANATFTETTVQVGDKTFPALKASTGLVLVPYCIWDNRKPGNDMQVWFQE